MKMNRTGCMALLAITLAAGTGGCRQADGTIPRPQGETANKTADVGRDLLNVAARSDGAKNDLFDDISNLTSSPPPATLMNEITTALDKAVAGKSPTAQSTQQLA